MKPLTLPAEPGSLRVFFLASILTHTAIIVAVPFLFAANPVPVVEGDDGGPGCYLPQPEESEPPPPTPLVEADPTPTPPEPDPTPDFNDVPPPPLPVVQPPTPVPPRIQPPRRPVSPNPNRGLPSTRPGPSRLVGPSGLQGPANTGISSPKPAYPFHARKMRLTGSGQVRAWTDPAGRVVRCEVSGLHNILAEHTRQHVLTNWRGPAGTQFTREIEYRLE